MRKLTNQIVYFVFAIVVLASMGVWLPIIIDVFNFSMIRTETFNIIPNNILSYSLSIFSIAVIDRFIYMVDLDRYKHKKLEVLISFIVVLVVGVFVFMTFYSLKNNNASAAMYYSIIGSCISFIMWWFANYKDTKLNPYDVLGGQVQ